MIYGTRITTLCIAILLSLSFTVSAEQVPELKIFTNGTKADAVDVNSNFSNLKETVNKNDLTEGGDVNGTLTVSAVTYSSPKSASVTYSAMGFTPENNTIQYLKNIANGSLSINSVTYGGEFFHSLTLRPGVTITRIRARVRDVTVSLLKKGDDDDDLVAEVSPSNEDLGKIVDIQVGDINHTIKEFPTSYFIAVNLGDLNDRFYSVAIDYTYTEP